MGKLNFPDTGLTNMVNAPFNDAFRGLNQALANCSFMVPNEFPYQSYLFSLGSTIQGYGQQMANLYSTIESIDKGYFSVFDSLDSNLSKVDRTIITERNRLIK